MTAANKTGSKNGRVAVFLILRRIASNMGLHSSLARWDEMMDKASTKSSTNSRRIQVATRADGLFLGGFPAGDLIAAAGFPAFFAGGFFTSDILLRVPDREQDRPRKAQTRAA